MTTGLLELLDYVSVAVYGGVALAAWRLHRRVSTEASRWLLITFATLAVVVTLGLILPDATPGSPLWLKVISDVRIVVLVLFPYALYRFAAGFRPPRRGLDIAAAAAFALLAAATFALPVLPEERSALTVWMQAFLFALLAYWTLLSVWVAPGLWRGGRGQPGVARRRMQLLSIGTLVMNAALLLVGCARSWSAQTTS